MSADPAAPVGKGAQRTQEVDKTPTPPPQESTPEPAPTAADAPSGGASESTAAPQTPAGGFAGFLEGLKSKIGQSPQSTSTSEDKVSAAESASTALEGNPSPSPSLTAAIEAEADKNSEKPAVQALIEGESLHLLITVAGCLLVSVTSISGYCLLAGVVLACPSISNWGGVKQQPYKACRTCMLEDKRLAAAGKEGLGISLHRGMLTSVYILFQLVAVCLLKLLHPAAASLAHFRTNTCPMGSRCRCRNKLDLQLGS